MTQFEKMICVLLGAIVALLLTMGMYLMSIYDSSEQRTISQTYFFDWYMEQFEAK